MGELYVGKSVSEERKAAVCGEFQFAIIDNQA